MDITRAFEASGLLDGVTINFQGTVEAPLFQANQIGSVLGLVNIREAIKDFDDDEKVVGPVETFGGMQNALFLTEVGLYRLLNLSRKPLARPFQKWVARVVMELRTKGRIELELNATRTQQHIVVLEAARVQSDSSLKKGRHDILVEAYARRPLLYMGDVGALPDGRFLVKYGETDDIAARAPGLQVSCGAFSLMDVFPCSEPHMLEQWLSVQREFVIRKHVGLVNGRKGREYLAVTSSDYAIIKRFIKVNMAAHSGWTIKQQLEKARYDAIRDLRHVTRDMCVMMQSSSPASSAVRAQLNDNLAETLRDLVARPRKDSGGCKFDDEDQNMVDDENDMIYGGEVQGNADVHDRVYDDEGKVDDVHDRVHDDDGQDDDLHDRVHDDDGQDVTQDTDMLPAADTVSPYLLPVPPKKTRGRPPKPRTPLTSDGAPLCRFLEECCILNSESKTLTALVRARHRLWRHSNSKADTTELCTFFDSHFQNVKETDVEHFMTSSYYKGVALKPWVPAVPGVGVFQADVDLFIKETCELHVMGRVRTSDLMAAFSTWKGEEYTMTNHERNRVMMHVQASFFRSMVPVTKGGDCAPGVFGMYLTTATAECRDVGYNRSPNTRCSVLKLNSRGIIVAVIESVQDFAKTVMGKTSAHACTQLTKCFADNMQGLVHTDGFLYMRSGDYRTKQAASHL